MQSNPNMIRMGETNRLRHGGGRKRRFAFAFAIPLIDLKLALAFQ